MFSLQELKEVLESDTRERFFGVITCVEPGCTNQMRYHEYDVEVPIYCETHRTREGRHSRVRVLKTEPEPPKKDPRVVLLCVNRSCRNRIEITKKDWMAGERPLCPKCGSVMLYNKEAKE